MAQLNDIALTLARAGDGWRGDGGWWIGGPLIFFALWIGILALLWFVFWRRGGPRERSGIDRGRDILAERYARGEISTDEYRERLDRLG
ncbi:MAG: SHOCT domain-containing protein [Thermomicrobiales bacterium]